MIFPKHNMHFFVKKVRTMNKKITSVSVILLLALSAFSFQSIRFVKADMNSALELNTGLNSGAISDSEPEIWYKISYPTNYYIYLNLGGLTENLDMEIWLYNTTSSQYEMAAKLDGSGTSNEIYFNFFAYYNDIVYIRVYQAAVGEESSFDLDYSNQYIDFGPTFGDTSGSIVGGISAFYYFERYGNSMLYAFANLYNLTSDLNLRLYKRNIDGWTWSIISDSSHSGTVNETIRLADPNNSPEGDKYIFEVYGTSGDYTLYMEQSSLINAYSLPTSGWSNGYYAQAIYYDATTTAPGFVHVYDLDADVTLEAYFYNASNEWEFIAASNNPGTQDEVIPINFDESINYLFLVFGSETGFSFDIREPAIDTEPNNIQLEALNLDSTEFGWGYIDDTADMYSVSLTAGDVLIVKLNQLNDTVNLIIYDASNTSLASINSAGESSVTLTYDSTSIQVVYITIMRVSGNTIYKLTRYLAQPGQFEWGVNVNDEFEFVSGQFSTYLDDFSAMRTKAVVKGIYNFENMDKVLMDGFIYNQMTSSWESDGQKFFFDSNNTWQEVYPGVWGYKSYWLTPGLMGDDGISHLFVIPTFSGIVNSSWLNDSANIIVQMFSSNYSIQTIGYSINVTFVQGSTTQEFKAVYNSSGVVQKLFIYQNETLMTYYLSKNLIVNLTINSPTDITYNKTTTGNRIVWTPTGTDGIYPKYLLYRNGTNIANGTWKSGNNIEVNVDGLNEGVYNYTIVLKNGLGTVLQDTVFVSVVIPPSPPTTEPSPSPSPTPSPEPEAPAGIPGYPLLILLGVAGIGVLMLKKRIATKSE
jgi:hypothetical protein